MTGEMTQSASSPNHVAVKGLHLRSLETFLSDDPEFVSFIDMQAALCLDKRSTQAAVNLLTRTGYLNHRPTSPPRYSLTKLTKRLLSPRECSPVSRSDGLLVMSKLLSVVGRRAEDTDHCRISAVTAFGMILDATAESLPWVQAKVTVSVTDGEMVGIGLRRIEKAIRFVHRCLLVDFVLESA